MGENEIILKLQEQCAELVSLVDEKNKLIDSFIKRLDESNRQFSVIQTRAQKDNIFENKAVNCLDLFQNFLKEAHLQNWTVERQYKTKISTNFVDVDLAKYQEFLEAHLNDDEQQEFKTFLFDLQLCEDKGCFAGQGSDRKKVVRIPSKVCKHLVNAGELVAK